MYFISGFYQKDNDMIFSRCFGYVKFLLEAIKIVTENEYDIYEYTYDYALIEKIDVGIMSSTSGVERYIFEWNDKKRCYEKCDEPEFIKNIINICQVG